MRILHLAGSETRGGAATAVVTVQSLVGGDILRASGSVWAEGYRCVGGFYSPILTRRLRRIVRGYDVVHLHRFGEWGTAALRTGRPTVYSAYDYWPMCPRQNLHPYPCDWDCVRCYQPKGWTVPRAAKVWLFGRAGRIRWHMRRLDALVVLSEDARRRHVECGIEARIHRVPLPVDIERPEGLVRMPGIVLYLGWLSPNKGLHVVLGAWPAVRRAVPRAQLLVAGPQPNAAYRAQCKLDQPGVVCLGEVSRKRAVALIALSAVVVVPEQWPNPQPLVLCEAAALGTPVVASPVGGIPEFGGAIYAETPEQWAAQIVRVLRGEVQMPPAHPTTSEQAKQAIEEVYRCASRPA